MKMETDELCNCNGAYPIYSDTESSEFGYYYRCSHCDKKIDGEIHYYNHYDGEDHDDVEFDEY